MLLAPVIERELRRASHSKKATKSRFRIALYGALVVLAYLLLFTFGGSGSFGQNLHLWLFLGGLYLAVVPPWRISAGLLSEERGNQTLELLFLTGMGSGELFVGKLLGGTLIASGDMLALGPFLAMPFLMGGISMDLFLGTVTCLPALFLFVLAVGVLASVLFRDDGAAFLFTVVLAAALSLATPLPYYLGRLLTGSPPFSAKWLCLSPAYAPYLISQRFGATGAGEFWSAMLALAGWSVLCLALAGFVLNRNWRAEILMARRPERRGWLSAWFYPGQLGLAALGNSRLPPNPFQWLTRQDRQPVLLAYGAIGLACLFWLLGWLTWPRAWPSTANFFITAMVLVAIVHGFRLFAAARRLGTDRREGMLELLLTTPLTTPEIVDGEVAALAEDFRPLQRLVCGLFVLMMAGGFLVRPWNVRAAITYVLVWGVLCAWCLTHPTGRVLKVMWAALNTGRPVHAVFHTNQNKWTWVWLCWNAQNLINHGFGGKANGFPSGSVLEFVIVCIIGVFVGVIYCFGDAKQRGIERETRRRLIMEMRLIAAEPLRDPNDPAFEKWDSIQRLSFLGVPAEVSAWWPLFVDPPKLTLRRAYGQPATSSAGSAADGIGIEDALDLFRCLEERKVTYTLIGGLAMDAYLGERTTKNVDVLMSTRALDGLPELEITKRVNHFCRARFRNTRVVIYGTENPFFETIRLRCTATLDLGGMRVPAATVEGLIALNLYALHVLSQQRIYYRQESYEINTAALLTLYQVSFEPILALIKPYVPEYDARQLEDTLNTCAKRSRRMRRQEQSLAPPPR
jgi:hypothetical protein